MTPWKMALTHLVRKKMMTTILFLSLAFSIAAAGLLLRVYILTQARFDSLARGGEAVIGAKAGGIEILLGSLNLEATHAGFLPFNLFNSLRAGQTVQFEDGAQVPTSSFVETVIPIVFFGTHDDAKVIGTDLTFFNRPVSQDSLPIRDGRYFLEGMGDEVVLGSEVAHARNLKVGDPFRVRMDDRPEDKDFTVIGILKPTSSAWDRGAYTSYQTVFRWFMEKNISHEIWNTGVFNYLLLYMKPPPHGGDLHSAFIGIKSLVNDRTVGQIISVEEEKKNLADLTGAGGELGFFIISFIILLSALSVTGMMLIRYEGMRLQTAVMRAMGFPPSYLFSWLLFEGLILSLGACVLGALIDLILFYPVVDLLGSAVPDVHIYSVSIFSSSPIWFAATLATLVGVCLPFQRLYRMDVHSVLKGL